MGMLWPTLETHARLAIVLVLWIGGSGVMSAWQASTVGDFVAFNTYMVQLTWPVIALGWVINIFQRGTASLVRINEIMHGEARDSTMLLPQALIGEEFRARSNSAISISAMQRHSRSCTTSTCAFPPAAAWPSSVRLAQARPRSSASIPRIYDAEPGTVLIDGRPIREYLAATCAANIGFVPQETFLFSDTHPREHRLRSRDATDEEIH